MIAVWYPTTVNDADSDQTCWTIGTTSDTGISFKLEPRGLHLNQVL